MKQTRVPTFPICQYVKERTWSKRNLLVSLSPATASLSLFSDSLSLSCLWRISLSLVRGFDCVRLMLFSEHLDLPFGWPFISSIRCCCCCCCCNVVVACTSLGGFSCFFFIAPFFGTLRPLSWYRSLCCCFWCCCLFVFFFLFAWFLVLGFVCSLLIWAPGWR